MAPHRSIRMLTALLALALFVAACGSDGSGNAVEAGPSTTTTPTTTRAAETTTTEAQVPNTASFRGVTADTIKVGISAFDWDRLASLGVTFGTSNNGDLGIAALESINDRGGIHGRMIEPVMVEFLPVGSTEADQACVELTEDNEVFLVVGVALNDQVNCFTELHQTATIVVSGMNDDRLARADAPYATVIATQEVRAANFVAEMAAAGLLEGTIGVMGFVDVSESVYRAVAGALVDAGYDPVEGLIGGNQDDLAATAREQELVYQRMLDAGVDTTISTTGVPLEIANARDAGYDTDQWLLYTSMTGRALTDAGVPLDYLDGAYTVNNSLVGTSAQPDLASDPDVAACLDDLRARTDHPLPYALEAEVNNINTALLSCASARIVEAALLNAGPNLTNESLQAGIEAVGEIELAGYLDASLGPDDFGAVKGLRLARFDGATGIWDVVES
ncbi:MAG: hypothetical protein AAF548_07485 [Actinomycetota bacterium]